jgi:hypothetical protein
MKSGLVALLSTESTITAICSTRVYVSKAPEKALLPYIIITQMSSEENPSLDGASGKLRFITFDIDCKSKTSVQAESLGNAVRTFIQDYTGAAGNYTIGAVIMNDESDSYEPPEDGSDVGVHVVTLDLDVQFNIA